MVILLLPALSLVQCRPQELDTSGGSEANKSEKASITSGSEREADAYKLGQPFNIKQVGKWALEARCGLQKLMNVV